IGAAVREQIFDAARREQSEPRVGCGFRLKVVSGFCDRRGLFLRHRRLRLLLRGGLRRLRDRRRFLANGQRRLDWKLILRWFLFVFFGRRRLWRSERHRLVEVHAADASRGGRGTLGETSQVPVGATAYPKGGVVKVSLTH